MRGGRIQESRRRSPSYGGQAGGKFSAYFKSINRWHAIKLNSDLDESLKTLKGLRNDIFNPQFL